MAEERNKETVEHLYAAFNKRDLGALEALLAPNFTDYTAGAGKSGAEGIKGAWREMWHHPDLHIHVKEIITEGERVAARVTFRGADGTILGHMAEFVRVKEGKVMELWNLARLS